MFATAGRMKLFFRGKMAVTVPEPCSTENSTISPTSGD